MFVCLGVLGSTLHTIHVPNTRRAFLVIPLQVGLTFGAFLLYLLLRKTLLSTYERIRFANLSKQYQVILSAIVCSSHYINLTSNENTVLFIIPLQISETVGAVLGYFILRRTLLSTFKKHDLLGFQSSFNYNRTFG
ncbi:unnamed protein product [Bursaphelenchus okinawaensis]|uniref:Uncharacterized protein n=1 Tax=Bursaphelenchus okinawaensis TaxID=465554 RepID=A0A811K0H2_9BILA|nr:unnamed protein product [Bursaphelenchus okinawaensis]CAG9089152.1 unnamed protein product [Bursaphelenchus okinawaensis]